MSLIEQRSFLETLPNDEFMILLRFLNLEQKKDFKLVSKTCEKRVIELDPSMRKWHLSFTPDYWWELGIELSMANKKHILDKNIQIIKLSLDFTKVCTAELQFTTLFLVDSIIKDWKNNIVHLEIKVCGLEFFFSNPNLKMIQLKSLTLSCGKDLVPNYITPKEDTVNILVDTHKDSLEQLELNGLNNPISCKLQLKELKITNITSTDTIISALKSSDLTLESFTYENYDYETINENENNLLEELHSVELPKLVKFKGSRVSAKVASKVIVQAQPSLKHLELIEIDKSSFELNNASLQLKVLICEDVPTNAIASLVNATCLTLQYLELKNLYKNTDSLDLEKDKLQIKRLKCVAIPTLFAATVINTSHKSLEELEFSDCIDYSSFQLNQSKLQLKKFIGREISNNFAATIINSSSSSLIELELIYLEDDFFRINQSMSQLKKFKGIGICTSSSASVINASNLSLEILELAYLKLDVSFNIDKSLHIRKFKGVNISLSVSESIINFSHRTLEDLYLEKIEADRPYMVLDTNMLKLKSFTAKDVQKHIVVTVLDSVQESGYNSLNAVRFEAIRLPEGEKRCDLEFVKTMLKLQSQIPPCYIQMDDLLIDDYDY